MPKTNNDIPLFAEEKTLYSEQNEFEKILSQFKQPIPSNFLKLEPAKKNNGGSTEDLDKPLCERYLFVRENKRIGIDIPHTLMEELELPIGKTCPGPFYLKPEVLEKEEIEGAITIEKEDEVFIDKPFTINSLSAALQNGPKEIQTLKEQVTSKNNRLLQLNQILQGSALIFQKQQQIIDDLKIHLQKEQEKNKDNTDYQEHLRKDIIDIVKIRKQQYELIHEIEDWFMEGIDLPKKFLGKGECEENAKCLEKGLSEDKEQKEHLEEWKEFIELIRTNELDDDFWRNDHNKGDEGKNHLKIYVKEFCLDEFTSFVKNLQKGPTQFPSQTPQQVQETIDSLANGNNEPVYQELRKQISNLKEDHNKFVEKIEEEVKKVVGREWNTTIYPNATEEESLFTNLRSVIWDLKEQKKKNTT